MKKTFLPTLFLVLLFSCKESEKKPAVNDNRAKPDSQVKVPLPPITHYTPPDKSPMDMIYFPSDYPLLKMTGKTSTPPLLRIIYSRPQKSNRKIFNDLVKYGSPWRLGANESTEIEFFSAATIQGLY